MCNKIKLDFLTRKGKNIITNHGNEWKIIRKTRSVQFSSEQGWMLIKSLQTKDLRWIKAKNDKNFKIIEENSPLTK